MSRPSLHVPKDQQRNDRQPAAEDDLYPAKTALLGATRTSTISTQVARALIEAAERAGLRRAALLGAARIEPALLDTPDARLPRAKLHQLCELALDLTGDPALGLHWAEQCGHSTFVPISHLLVHSSTLRHALGSLDRFYKLLSDDASHQIIERGDTVTVRHLHVASESARMQRLSAEMTVAGLFRLVRSFSIDARIESVSFQYGAPSYQTEYTRVFEQTVRFAQPFSGVVFARTLLDMPAPHKDHDVHTVLTALAERRLLRIARRTPYAMRVRDFLVRDGWRSRADMEAVARALGLSVRSLRRRLAEEDKSYVDIANEALAIVATHFLRDKQFTIQATAYEMGFSDASTFHRAFKRWTGTTPSAYRESDLDEIEG